MGSSQPTRNSATSSLKSTVSPIKKLLGTSARRRRHRRFRQRPVRPRRRRQLRQPARVSPIRSRQAATVYPRRKTQRRGAQRADQRGRRGRAPRRQREGRAGVRPAGRHVRFSHDAQARRTSPTGSPYRSNSTRGTPPKPGGASKLCSAPPPWSWRQGGEWTDPETGEVFPKLHLHWRLSEPTREAADHAILKPPGKNIQATPVTISCARTHLAFAPVLVPLTDGAKSMQSVRTTTFRQGVQPSQPFSLPPWRH